MTNDERIVDDNGASVVQPKIDPLPAGTPVVKRFYADATHYHIEVEFSGDAGTTYGSIAFVDIPEELRDDDDAAEQLLIAEARKQRDLVRTIRVIRG